MFFVHANKSVLVIFIIKWSLILQIWVYSMPKLDKIMLLIKTMITETGYITAKLFLHAGIVLFDFIGSIF
jgi:hypothetical protein